MHAIKNFSERRCQNFLKHVVLSVLHIKQQEAQWLQHNMQPNTGMAEHYDYLDLDMSLLGDDMLQFEDFNPEENGVDSVDSWDSMGESLSHFQSVPHPFTNHHNLSYRLLPRLHR